MYRQLFRKKFWKRFGLFLVLFGTFFFFTAWLFREENDSFWTLSYLSGKAGFTVFMALFLAYRHDETNESPAASLPPDEYVVIRPGLKQFLMGYFFLLLLVLLILAAGISIAWGVFYFFFDQSEPLGPTIVKLAAASAVMCLGINSYFFLSDWRRYNRWRKEQQST